MAPAEAPIPTILNSELRSVMAYKQFKRAKKKRQVGIYITFFSGATDFFKTGSIFFLRGIASIMRA
jgi:hypothetical protein